MESHTVWSVNDVAAEDPLETFYEPTGVGFRETDIDISSPTRYD